MYERIEESGTDRSRTEEYGMRTLLDYIGLNPLRPLVAFGGDESGGNGGDSRPEEAKALDETDVSVGYGSGEVDPGLASAVGLAPAGGYSGITGPSAYEISEALGGGDRDPTPTPVPVAQSVVDYSDVDLSGLPSLPQEIPVKYEDTTSGIEEVVDFYSPPEFGYDLRDPNEPEVMMQDGKLFSGIAYGERYESGQPVGSVSMDNIAGLGKLELPDLSAPDPLVPTGSTTKIASPGGVGPGQTVDFNRLIDAGDTQNYDIYSPPLTDDDMGLPDISVDEAMFTRGDLGRSDVAGGTSIPLDPLGLATGLDDDPYSATLARDDVVGDVAGDVVTSASVPDVDIPSNKNVIDAVVAGVLTGTPVEGFDIQTSKIGMPREGLLGDLNNLFGSLGGQIILDSLIPGAGLVTGFASIVDPQKRQRIADMLSGYSGQAVYNSKGELIGAVDKMTGEYVGYPSNEGGFVRGDEGNLVRSNADVPKYADPFAGGDDDDVSVCPAGYEFDANIGQCVPIVAAEEEPKISLKDVDRPDPGEIGIPVIPDEDPVEGMKIRTPKFFNRGGPVTPNIDRFLGSLRG
jgi:hypothetical protein